METVLGTNDAWKALVCAKVDTKMEDYSYVY